MKKNVKRKKKPTSKRRTTIARPAARQPRWPQSSLDPARDLAVVPSKSDETTEAGQSGDSTQLSELATADSESVRELVDEGQDYEAEIISGIERAIDPEEPVPVHKRKKSAS